MLFWRDIPDVLGDGKWLHLPGRVPLGVPFDVGPRPEGGKFDAILVGGFWRYFLRAIVQEGFDGRTVYIPEGGISTYKFGEFFQDALFVNESIFFAALFSVQKVKSNDLI
jgi:hypothetical protein